jgi:broad specificity phosphatase PhoE
VGLRGGPSEITLVRHGESVGNVADAEAQARDAEELGLDARDADVELSDTGRRQARALAGWLENAAEDDRPTLVLTSPYRRAADTARLAVGETGIEVVTDERLRERDLGIFDGLTGQGIRSRHGDEAQRRKKVGKFYYQPPAGESWADVVLRVRSLLADLRQGFDDARVWMFSHQAVIMSFRYVLEGMDESELLDIADRSPIANVSLTTYRRSEAGLALVHFADTTIVDRAGAT